MTGAKVHRWPSVAAWRLLNKLPSIVGLALEAWALGDLDLLADCQRWHEQACAALKAERGSDFGRGAS